MIHAINLLPLRPGVGIDDFLRFSREVDVPACLASPVVRDMEVFEVQAAEGRSAMYRIAEVMVLSSWSDWQEALWTDSALVSASAQFKQLVDSDQVLTVLGRRIDR